MSRIDRDEWLCRITESWFKRHGMSACDSATQRPNSGSEYSALFAELYKARGKEVIDVLNRWDLMFEQGAFIESKGISESR